MFYSSRIVRRYRRPLPGFFHLVLAIALFSIVPPAHAEYFSIQIAAFADDFRREALQSTLTDAGYRCHVINDGAVSKLRVGPYRERGAAESESNALWHFLIARFGPNGIHKPWIIAEEKSLVSDAISFLGTPYQWGGDTSDGFDCSGFTSFVLARAGISIPRTAENQYLDGAIVGRTNLEPGDLVFFSTYKPGPSHVGIYVGNGNFLHASSGSGKIVLTSIASSYYEERYLGARRY